MFFYENYVRLCNSVGKTPSAVAKEIGIQKSTVTRWKNGKGRTDATVQKVADYFGVSKSFLLNSAPDPEEIILFEGIFDDEVNEKTERRIIAFENKTNEKSPAPEGAERIPGYSDLSATNKAIVDSMIAQLLAAQLEG